MPDIPGEASIVGIEDTRSSNTFCQIESRFDQPTYESIVHGDPNSHKKKDVLMLFCDRSYSMHGAPFKALTEGMIDIADIIFDKNAAGEANFSDVHVVYYDNLLYDKVTHNKEEYLEKVRSEEAHGDTNFLICFDYMEKHLKEYDENTRFSIIFLTDGNAT